MSDRGLWSECDFEVRMAEARARLCLGLAAFASFPGAPPRLGDEAFADALMQLMALVLERDKDVNLTAITDPVEFAELHLLDSLTPASLPALAMSTDLIDIGSGAGFPGLPLALLFPEKRFVLADALRKRTDFIAFAAEELGLPGVTAVHARAEALGREFAYRESFDIALCRAVAALPIALEYTMPLVRVGGTGIFFKTVRAEGEIRCSRLALELLGASAEVEVAKNTDVLPGRAHALYLVRKERATPKTYPRRDGVPRKAPL
ncbi:MAG: 16S rRNA (guanine(527)-N(7))-methyltransferase RsmG [Clostridiales Family XIII bacterium]|jgi:16S rRNA (guanine527-N7)-methyltransferase|nr:16S rRNA (guanine(527)-N(7))-methyltransferase RsmG [Clostridiales Family XIII bacterium]